MQELNPTYFARPEDFRRWLEAHHTHAKELLVGYYKVSSKIESITWPQSVDQALCFGWIDGVRRSIDDQRYCIRFTPRKKNSIWSAVNLRRIIELDELGLLADAGRKVWQERHPDQEAGYSIAQGTTSLPPEYEALLQANEAAWAYWQAAVASYRKPVVWWVMQAKQEATRQKRLGILIDCSAKSEKIPSQKRIGEK